MISCKLAGGLGNQLFQIFTTIAYALKYSKAFSHKLSVNIICSMFKSNLKFLNKNATDKGI